MFGTHVGPTWGPVGVIQGRLGHPWTLVGDLSTLPGSMLELSWVLSWGHVARVGARWPRWGPKWIQWGPKWDLKCEKMQRRDCQRTGGFNEVSGLLAASR